MKTTFTLIQIIFLFFSTCLCAQITIRNNHTIIVQPDGSCGQDTYIAFCTPYGDDTTNYSWAGEIDAIAGTVNGTSAFGRSLLQFDLSQIPTGAKVEGATLSLYFDPTSSNGQHRNSSGENDAWLQKVTAPWNLKTVTWNTQPPTDTTNEAYLPPSTSPTEDYTNIDVRAMVQDFVNNPAQNYGMMLRLVSESIYHSLIFASSRNSDPALHPKLVVSYIPLNSACYSLQYGSCYGTDAMPSLCTPYGYDTTNFGNIGEFDCYRGTANGNDARARSLIYWNLTQIPVNATVSSAKLSLYFDPTASNGQHRNDGGPNDAWLQKVTGPWGEENVTWDNQPPTDTTNEAYLPPSTYATEDYPDIDVTALVQDMVSHPQNNYGLMLKLVTEIKYRFLIFASSDNPDPTKHPKLDICYAVPLGNPPAPEFAADDSVFCGQGCANFADLSTGSPTSWLWTFAGATPSSSTLQNPQNICYYAPGAYDVKLKASNLGGSDSITFSNYINIFPVPRLPVIIQSGDTLTCTTDPGYSSYQWYEDSTLIPNETDTFLIISHAGNYGVRITSENGCSISAATTAVGIEEFTVYGLQFTVSPNPVGDELIINSAHAGSLTGKSKLTIFNALGEIIYKTEINSKRETINCKPFSAGIYFVQIANEDERWVGKFVKE